MYYTNSMKVTLKNKKVAAAALEILRTRLPAGFACDNGYKNAPSLLMLDGLCVEKSTIVLPEDFGCLVPEDAENTLPELIQYLAENLHEDFTCEIYNYSDYSEGEISAEFVGGTLTIKSIFYPNGYCEELYCPECGEAVIRIEDYVEGTTYICPECGEEIDLSEDYEEHKPIITERKIIVK